MMRKMAANFFTLFMFVHKFLNKHFFSLISMQRGGKEDNYEDMEEDEENRRTTNETFGLQFFAAKFRYWQKRFSRPKIFASKILIWQKFGELFQFGKNSARILRVR